MDLSTARRRRSSVPSQHYLSGALATEANEVRFRDEMGIHDVVGITSEGHPTLVPSHRASTQHHYTNAGVNPHLVNNTSADVKWRPNDIKRDPHTNTSATRDVERAGTSSNDASTSLLSMKVEDSVVQLDSSLSMDVPAKKKVRKKWTIEETKMLVDGCNKHGVGNWKAMLDDASLTFDPDRTPVDLKDRFRTYFPEAYRHLYPNARTHLSSSTRHRTELPDSLTIFEKNRSKKRRPFTKEEDEALREGFEKHGTVWALIAKNPALASRRSTDLRDRFRNAFPALYEKAGYKPRPARPMKIRRSDSGIQPTVASTGRNLNQGPTPTHNSSGHSSGQHSALDGPSPASGISGQHNESMRDTSMEPPLLTSTPEADESFDGTSADMPKTPQMSSSHALIEADSSGIRPGAVKSESFNSGSLPSSKSNIQMHSRQRSSSYSQNQDSADNFTSRPQIPGQPTASSSSQQQQQPQEAHPSFDPEKYGSAWYPARWLSGTQGYGENEMNDVSFSAGARSSETHSQHIPPEAFSYGATLGFPGFGLSAGGYSNQQAVIDRYDLPSSSLLHGGEFQSEAAIGDTGSSISGLDEFNANLNMSMSSHHKYAGDLFHARGAGFGGGGGWNTWGNNPTGMGLVFGGGGQERMPSFSRAAIHMGAPAPSNPHQTATVTNQRMGGNMSGLDLGSAAQSPELAQVLRQDLSLDAIDELEAVLGSSVLASPHSVDPAKTMLHDSTPPPGTPLTSSPPLRGYNGINVYNNNNGNSSPDISSAGLTRHASMGTTEPINNMQGHRNLHQSAYHPNHHSHAHSSSHSRSYSQPPSEHRVQPGMGRTATTTVSSPVKGASQTLDGSGYGHGSGSGNYNSSQSSGSEAFTPAGTPNQHVQHLPQQPQTHSPHHGQHHPHLQHSHSHPSQHGLPHQQHHVQQQHTPVQSHASLHPLASLYHPPTSSPQLFSGPSGGWGQLSTAAMALDLHGYQSHQSTHSHPTSHGIYASAMGLTMGGNAMGLNTSGNPSGNSFMDQYLDFDTHALDLATAVAPGPGSTFSTALTSIGSPDIPMSVPGPMAPPNQVPPSHQQSTSASNPPSQQQRPVFRSPAVPNLNTPTFSHVQTQPQAQPTFNSISTSLLGLGSMDDSTIAQHTTSSHPHPGGMPRRESFSFGTTPAMHPNSLNRVHSAESSGLAGRGASGSGGTLKSKGWDKTITSKTAKRSSWSAMKSFGNI